MGLGAKSEERKRARELEIVKPGEATAVEHIMTNHQREPPRLLILMIDSR